MDDKKVCEATEQDKISRRSFFEKLIYLLSGFMTVLIGLPLVGFIFKPIFKPVPPVWRPVGKVDSFKIGDTVAVTFLNSAPLAWAGTTAKATAWLRRESKDSFIAFYLNCTHLGCPVRWRPEAELFMCPCHGGVYYKDGTVAAGPPPLPLPRYETRINNDQVELLVTL